MQDINLLRLSVQAAIDNYDVDLLFINFSQLLQFSPEELKEEKTIADDIRENLSKPSDSRDILIIIGIVDQVN